MIKSAKRKNETPEKVIKEKKTKSTHRTRRDRRYGPKILITLKKERWSSK